MDGVNLADILLPVYEILKVDNGSCPYSFISWKIRLQKHHNSWILWCKHYISYQEEEEQWICSISNWNWRNLYNISREIYDYKSETRSLLQLNLNLQSGKRSASSATNIHSQEEEDIRLCRLFCSFWRVTK